MGPHIRPFEPRDQVGVATLVLEIQQHEFGIPISAAEQPDLLDVARSYRRGAGNFWGATEGPAVVGTVGLLDIGHGDGALRKMFVARAFRGAAQGVAAGLLGACLRWAHDHALRRVLLGTTEQFQAAHRFYEKSGFRLVDPASVPGHFPRMRQDTLFYAFALSSPDPPLVKGIGP